MSINKRRNLGRFATLLAAFMAMGALGAIAPPASVSAQSPAPGPPVPQATFHFSDPGLDREYLRLNAEIVRAEQPFGRALSSARALVWEARGTRPGSAAWARARDAVGEVIRSQRLLSENYFAYIAFLTTASRRAPANEAQVAIGDRYVAQERRSATGDRLLELLEDLAGLGSGR
jgi:hypothetical protein